MRYFITGGAGFIGSNYADRLLGRGNEVYVFDNLSRAGALSNVRWLMEKHGHDCPLTIGIEDVRSLEKVKAALLQYQPDVIVHLAGQVTVTESVTDVWGDFTSNVIGTLNVLMAVDCMRARGAFDPVFIFASTNKVYGTLDWVELGETKTRHVLDGIGIHEYCPLDFRTPYGCSKGAADQYVLEYGRRGLNTFVLRQSCIYGPRQFGYEAQGWLAWLMIAALRGDPITIYGDGKQVRDVLYVTDLLDLYDAIVEKKDWPDGVDRVLNVGGGPRNTLSVWAEYGDLLSSLVGEPVEVSYDDWRPADQRVYISDIRKAQRVLGWVPRVSTVEGIHMLFEWIENHKVLILDVMGGKETRPLVRDDWELV